MRGGRSKCPKCCPKQCESCPVQHVESTSSNSDRLARKDSQNSRDHSRHCSREKVAQKSQKKKKCNDFEEFKEPSKEFIVTKPEVKKYCPVHPDRVQNDDVRIPLTVPVAIQILKNWFGDVTYEIDEALYDVKCIWSSAEDDLSTKLCATNRLLIYYLLIMAIYIIQICFMIDEKLFEGLCKIFSSLNEGN